MVDQPILLTGISMDLTAVSATVSAAPPPSSRRVWARHSSTRPFPRRLRVADSQTDLDAWILDLSAGGLGLLVSEAVAVGTLLQVELETCPEAAPIQGWASVVHCQPTEDGEFRLGCQFVATLTDDDLHILLQ
jgi:hypothetical protein